jgi:hypothetical protein
MAGRIAINLCLTATIACSLEVDDEPALVECGTFHGYIQPLSHEALTAVATDKVVACHVVAAAICRPERDDYSSFELR